MIVIAMQERELDYKMPTHSHVMLSELVNSNIVKFIVTSNHDNLHVKAGTPSDKVIDLFGNVCVEECGRCKKQWRRSVVVPSIGRKCDDPECQGKLFKTQTRMYGQTPEKPLKKATKQAKLADLALVFGSSMTISPFCNLPELAKKYVICNLQPTNYDDGAELVIRTRIDKVFKNISNFTNVVCNDYIYRQGFIFTYEKVGENDWKFMVISGRLSEQPQCIENVVVNSNYFLANMTEDTYSYSLNLRCPLNTEVNVEFLFKESFNVESKSISFVLDREKNEFESFLEKRVIFEGED